MKCPKCGAFVEDGKQICFMCGTNVNNFGAGSQPTFSEYSSTFSDDYSKKKEEYNNRFDYKKVDYNKNVPKEEKDIFDFFSENKTKIKIVGFFLVLVIAVFCLYKYVSYKTDVKPLVPVLNELYFEVDDTFKNVSSSQSEVVYVKTGDKGADCSIMVGFGTSTSGDHVQDLYKNIKANAESSYMDDDGTVIDQSLVPLYQESQININNTTWYYLNAYYRATEYGEYNILKNKYLSSVFGGHYYDITLINNANDNACNNSLDRFVRTLEFVES